MGIRKVNLNELKGSLNQRGRVRYQNDELKNAFVDLLATGEAFIWDDAKVEGKTEKAQKASKGKWRNRAVSVFTSLNSEEKISVQWTTENEMVISLHA